MSAKPSQELQDYFVWLVAKVNEGALRAEAELSVTVMARALFPEMPRLLSILGYDEAGAVTEQYPIVSGSRTLALDFLVAKPPRSWALELKAPSTTLTLGHAKQLRDYMARAKTLIGVLFNGREAKCFVDASRAATSSVSPDTVERLSVRPAFEAASLEGAAGLARFFATFSAGKYPGTSLTLARRLVKQWDSRELAQRRQAVVHRALEQCLRHPDDAVARALVAASSELAAMTPPVEPSEAIAAWPFGPAPSSPAPKPGQLNPRVRELVAEACRKLGYENLLSLGLKGLATSQEEPPPNDGYWPVPAMEGVPDGLKVMGVNSNTAKRLISALESAIG
jgi:hypothetical protein